MCSFGMERCMRTPRPAAILIPSPRSTRETLPPGTRGIVAPEPEMDTPQQEEDDDADPNHAGARVPGPNCLDLARQIHRRPPAHQGRWPRLQHLGSPRAEGRASRALVQESLGSQLRARRARDARGPYDWPALDARARGALLRRPEGQAPDHSG